MISTEIINKAATVSRLGNKLKRYLDVNNAIMSGYTISLIGLLAVVNLNDLAGRQILNQAQERAVGLLLVPAILGGLAESINFGQVEKKAKQMTRIQDKLISRFERTS